MKKALVIAIALVMGLGIAAFAASPFSGSWETNLTFGFRDIVINDNDTGELLAVVPGLQLDILVDSNGCLSAKIPDYQITLSIGGKEGTYDVPAHWVPVGPYSVSAPAVNFTIPGCCPPAATSIAFPAQPGMATFCGNNYNITIPGKTVPFFAYPGQISILNYNSNTTLWLKDNTTTTTSQLSPSPTISRPIRVTFSGPPWVNGTFILPPITRSVSIDNGTVEEYLTIPPKTVTVPLCATSVTVQTRSVTSADGGATIYVPPTTYTITYPNGCGVYATLPARTFTVSASYNNSPAQLMTITAPPITIGPFTLDANGNVAPQPVTIPAQNFSVLADTAVIPAITNAQVTVGTNTYTFNIPARTVTIGSPATSLVEVPGLTLDIPVVGNSNLTQTERVPTLGFTSTLIVDYTVGGWTFESTSKFADTGWTAQEFTANGNLGAFTISSDLVFDPTVPSFTKWDNTGKVSIAGVDLSGEFLLGPTGSGWTFGASGTAGNLTLGANAYFNMTSSGDLVDATSHCFCFSSVEFTASAGFACIDKVSATLDFDTSGFDSIDFSVKGIAIPNISWLTFDANVSFATTSKSVTLTPNINLGEFVCITPYYDLLTSGTYQITGIDIYGLGLSYTWNGVTFTDKTSFDSAKNEDVTGNADYWELFQLESSGDSCCGGAVDFSVSTYFKAGSGQLFGWGETDASLSLGIGSNYTISSGLNINESGLKQLTGGFKVTW